MRRACLALLLAACTREASIGAVREYPVVAPDKVDVLFIIDRSDSMMGKQAQLAENLPRTLGVLEGLRGGLPSLHVGVITSDLGAGPYTLETCSGDGDGGELQSSPRVDGCSPPSGAFLADEIGPAGERARNYSGALADAFGCIARVGIGGCGFEQPLAAMRRALDGSVPGNQGFLRPDAFLVLVFVTDEDDCSAADPAALFDPAPEAVATLGALTSFRCTRFGLLCGGRELDAAGEHRNCEPRAGALVSHTDDFTGFLRFIRDPRALFVAVIAGPPSPVIVRPAPSGLALAPACTHEGGFAQPATRLAAFAEAFPNHAFHSLCDDDLPDVLAALGNDISRTIFAYESDERGDLDISYGCATGHTPAPLCLLVLALLAARRRFS